MKVAQSKEELKNHVFEHIRFIQKSSKDFDEGDVSEAKRMAVHVRSLVHDTQNSRSLLLIMGDKDKILFLNSASLLNPKNLMSYMGLVSLHVINDEIGFRAKYKPLLEKSGKNDWRVFSE
jgi:hypothetical protein